MTTIRFGTFETNSSSAHSLILAKKDDFDAFKTGNMVLHMGGFGVSEEYLEERGWGTEGGQDGKLLTWQEARDEYVKWLKSWRHLDSDLDDLKRVYGIKKPDDLTTELFKKIIETERSWIIFGDFKTFDDWEKGYSDYGEDDPQAKSTWSINADGLVEMETNWRDG